MLDEAHSIFDLAKTYLVNIALCVFLLLGIIELILEKLEKLIPKFKEIKRLLCQERSSAKADDS